MKTTYIKDAENLHKEGEFVDFENRKMVIVMIIDDRVFLRDPTLMEQALIRFKGMFKR